MWSSTHASAIQRHVQKLVKFVFCSFTARLDARAVPCQAILSLNLTALPLVALVEWLPVLDFA